MRLLMDNLLRIIFTTPFTMGNVLLAEHHRMSFSWNVIEKNFLFKTCLGC
jgi:hypothetical protein